MTPLEAALRQRRWEVAALCLLIGLLEAARELSAEGLTGLLEALEGEGYGRHR